MRIAISVAAVFVSATAAAAPIDDIKSLLDQGKPAEAYQTAQSSRSMLGDPEFDFHYGIASIDSGHVGEGVLALERHVFSRPDNLRARLELARGHFLLGEDERARDEFLLVKAQAIPPDVMASVDRYLEAITERVAQRGMQARFHVEAGAGHDTNINGGVGNSLVNVPVFGNILLAPAARATQAALSHLAGGGQWTLPMTSRTTAFAGLDGEFRAYAGNKNFDQMNGAAQAGFSYRGDGWTARAAIVHSALWLGGNPYRSFTGANGEALAPVSSNQAIGVNAGLFKIEHDGANGFRDSDLSMLGLSYRHGFAVAWQPVLSLSASATRDRNLRSRDEYSRDISGYRASLAASPAPDWKVAAAFSHQDHRYRAPDPFFGVARGDIYQALEVSATHAYSKQLSLRGEVSYADNRSNVSLNAYDRTIAALKLRYDF